MQFTLSQIAQLCSGRLYGADLAVGSVITDSRTISIAQDSVFVAMQGVNHDAHNYIGDMVERGVRAFIQYLQKRGLTTVTEPPKLIGEPLTYIPHAFTEEELSRFFHECDNIPARENYSHEIFRIILTRWQINEGRNLTY